MAISIVLIVIIALFLTSTEPVNRMNRAAVAMFAGTTCWILYILWGADFVQAVHQDEFAGYLDGAAQTSGNVKEFVAGNIFLKYTMNAASVVLFLLGTTTIVEVLNNNGCFDFAHEVLRTRHPRRYLWCVAGITFVLSANLDNLTSACLMLAISHTLLADKSMRLTAGSVIVLAANLGGTFTVIGDITSLTLWERGLVTATTYSGRLILPCLVTLLVTLLLTDRRLPYSMRLVRTLPPYRGDDTILNRWQRGLMLAVGIGGLWFIPTFHRITHLPPFLGAFCVLGVLWIVNELCNRHLLRTEMMVKKRAPFALQYQNAQNMLYFVGISLAIGALNESGVLPWLCDKSLELIQNIYIIGILSGTLSAVFNNITVMLMNIDIFSHAGTNADFASNGLFWPFLSYCTAVGGSLLAIGSMAGLAFIRMEEGALKWYFVHFFPKVAIGFAAGGIVFYILSFIQ